MSTGAGIIVATLIGCTTYWATSSNVIVTAGAGGIFVINQEAGKVTFCIRTSEDRPECRTEPIITEW
jgi:hypothetical protein